jgi:hypothetical protein
VLELGRQETRLKLENDDRVETLMEYLLEKAPKSCFDGPFNGDECMANLQASCGQAGAQILSPG